MAETLTLTTDDEIPRQRLDRWLAENSGVEALSRSRIKNLILDGRIELIEVDKQGAAGQHIILEPGN